MSDQERAPVDPFDNPDPFSDVDLSQFSKSKTKKSRAGEKKVSQEEVKEVAKSANFTSRQPAKEKEHILPRTFSLYPAELDIIEGCVDDFKQSLDRSVRYRTSLPSGSDVVRAALHYFNSLDVEEQQKLLSEHRGRSGR